MQAPRLRGRFRGGLEVVHVERFPVSRQTQASYSIQGRKASSSRARVVRRHLEQLLLSPDFDASRRSRDFLCFVVEEALAGRGEELTQAALATQVFGRKDDFDALVDPIVRIQAGRLRRSLERYYILEGKGQALRIELPKGTYVPVFHDVETAETEAPERFAVSRPEAGGGPAASTAGPAPGGPEFVAAANPWPSIAVKPFEVAAGDAAHQEIVTRLQDELIGGARPVPRRPSRSAMGRGEAGSPHRQDARFELGGRIRHEDGDFVVTAHLVDCATGEHVWGDDYHTTRPPRPVGGDPGRHRPRHRGAGGSRGRRRHPAPGHRTSKEEDRSPHSLRRDAPLLRVLPGPRPGDPRPRPGGAASGGEGGPRMWSGLDPARPGVPGQLRLRGDLHPHPHRPDDHLRPPRRSRGSFQPKGPVHPRRRPFWSRESCRRPGRSWSRPSD